jgi:hypothetical protein
MCGKVLGGGLAAPRFLPPYSSAQFDDLIPVELSHQ